MGGAPLTVVRLGGSYALSRSLPDWLAAITSCAGHIVLVPGGGPFADTVRRAQDVMGFDDETAHHLALLAMEQFGRALGALADGLIQTDSVADIHAAVGDGKVPVWSPARMVLEATDIPASWDATSDSLAAWLAGQIGARHLVLVKHIELAVDPVRLDDLVEKEIVDPLFGRFVATSGTRAAIVGPADHATAAAAIRKGELPGARIVLR